MLQLAFNTMRDLPRLHEITSVLIRHGLGDVVQRIGVSACSSAPGQILQWGASAESHEAGAARARAPRAARSSARRSSSWASCSPRASICSRPSGSPSSRSCTATSRRFRSRSCCRSSRARSDDRRSRSSSISRLARTGSASIAQVHRAKLQDGTTVVLKVRRPGIRPKVEADLRLLGHLAQLVDSEMPEARRYQPIEIAAQFARSLERELDFTHRGEQHRALRQGFRRRSVHRHSEGLP